MAGAPLHRGLGHRETIDHWPVTPGLVVEFAGDTAVDEGRYRHPVRFLRVRDDLSPEQLPPSGARACPADHDVVGCNACTAR